MGDADRLACGGDLLDDFGRGGLFDFYLRDAREDEGAFIFTADDVEAALFSEEGEQALVDIDEADVVASLVIDKQFFQLAFGDADAGVVDVDLEMVLVLDEACLLYTSPSPRD